MLETNVRTLPEDISHTASNVADLLSLEVRKAEKLGDLGKANYLEHPPSNAVDMKANSVFRSFSRKSLDQVS